MLYVYHGNYVSCFINMVFIHTAQQNNNINLAALILLLLPILAIFLFITGLVMGRLCTVDQSLSQKGIVPALRIHD